MVTHNCLRGALKQIPSRWYTRKHPFPPAPTYALNGNNFREFITKSTFTSYKAKIILKFQFHLMIFWCCRKLRFTTKSTVALSMTISINICAMLCSQVIALCTLKVMKLLDLFDHKYNASHKVVHFIFVLSLAHVRRDEKWAFSVHI